MSTSSIEKYTPEQIRHIQKRRELADEAALREGATRRKDGILDFTNKQMDEARREMLSEGLGRRNTPPENQKILWRAPTFAQ